jgi:hypothetical protein
MIQRYSINLTQNLAASNTSARAPASQKKNVLITPTGLVLHEVQSNSKKPGNPKNYSTPGFNERQTKRPVESSTIKLKLNIKDLKYVKANPNLPKKLIVTRELLGMKNTQVMHNARSNAAALMTNHQTQNTAVIHTAPGFMQANGNAFPQRPAPARAGLQAPVNLANNGNQGNGNLAINRRVGQPGTFIPQNAAVRSQQSFDPQQGG